MASGQAAIVTAINRVSGIYENEFSIRLVLVANNNQLVYTNANTDPYTNNNAVALLGENQTNVDAVIGAASYDIGHVFTTGGGGLAGLGVVGISGQKARGETGLPNPIGDAFYVDYVAHEMGHQFGANHTFNGDSGACTTNINTSTAYEPGSGSSIMGYAGICGNDDLQVNSDPFFHWVSFDEVIAHVDTVIPQVGTRTPTGNSVPTVNAGSNFTIPASTPFQLTAAGSDGDAADVLIYSWEQANLGPQQDVSAGDNGSSPLFRSFSATTDAVRVFPRYQDLLNNTTVVGETLPTTARSLDFRVTVRDNRPGGGGVNTDDVSLSVVNTGAPFVVTNPNINLVWPADSTQTVTWDVAGTTGNGINTSNVRILLSFDGGQTFDTVLVANTPNDGAQEITVPEQLTLQARVRVEAIGNIFFDISNQNFQIGEPIRGPELVAINPTANAIFNFDTNPAPGPLDNVLTLSPRELTFRFVTTPGLDVNTLPAIRIIGSGDGIFGNQDDFVVSPGLLGFGDSDQIVVARFAKPLPDDLYRIEISSVDNAAGGVVALRNTGGLALVPRVPDTDHDTIYFEVETGAQVLAVVPQPISRSGGGTLVQQRDQIVVYFDQDEVKASSAENPAFYKLINTQGTGTPSDDVRISPTSVSYNSVANTATLQFAAVLPNGTFHLQIGESDEPNDVLASAVRLGSLFNFDSAAADFQTTGFIGDANGAADIDLYRFNLPVAATITAVLTPQSGNDTRLRLLDSAGGQIAISALAGADTLTMALAAGDYYLDVAGSDGSVGSYRLTLDTNNALPTINDNNTSFTTASVLGFLGAAQQRLTAQIEPQAFQFAALPGGNDEPGHRSIPVEDHLNEFGLTLGGAADTTNGIPTFLYNFQQSYGPQGTGSTFLNAITAAQKDRAREIFDLYSHYLGIHFEEVDCTGVLDGSCAGLTVATGDLAAVDPSLPPNGPAGVYGGGTVVVNGTLDFGDSEFGGRWFNIALHEIGHAIGLGHSYDLPSIQGNGLTGEPVYPGDYDILHGQRLYRPDSNDIDLYKFTLDQPGAFTAEVMAERLAAISPLNSVLTLYREVATTSGPAREVIARNDDYFSSDSYLELDLEPGVYYLGVTSTGNTSYNPAIADSGYGGTTQGTYDLLLDFHATAQSSLVDTAGTALDGDADGVAGGVFDFWFQSGGTVFVDKLNNPTAGVDGDGTIGNPFDNIASALAAADASATNKIVRIVGNEGVDGDFNLRGDNDPYLVGLDNQNADLPDGKEFLVPRNVTVMIDGGTLIKLRGANIDVGTSAQGVPRDGGALQVLGTPAAPVYFRSLRNDAEGGDSDGQSIGARPGDWGGLVFRADSDHEQNGIFLNTVNFGDLNNGGGKVFIDSVERTFAPVHLIDARPTISFNRITNSADAAVSANPNSFDDSRRRIGPDIHGNTILDNSINGLFVRIDTETGQPTPKLNVAARWDDTDIVHVLTSNLLISGTPGGPTLTFETERLSYLGQPNGGTFQLEFNDGNGPLVTPAIPFNAPVNTRTNERQSISTAGATSGTFRLQFAGATVVAQTPLPFNASAAQVQAALESLSTIDPGDIRVTGGPLNVTPVEVEFMGQFAGTDVGLLTVLDNTTNRVQAVSAVDATSGSFKLEFAGASVAAQPAISFNATAAQVQAALETLTTINVGDVVVTGGPLNVAPINVEFRGQYAGLDVSSMIVQNNTVNTVPTVVPVARPAIIESAAIIIPIREHLENLATIDPGDIVLTGGPLPGNPVTIRFGGQFTARDIPGLRIVNALVTGGAPRIDVIGNGALSDARLDARLAIDPGATVKLVGARIETEFGAQLIAEGTPNNPVIFTSISDDRYGYGSTFDTKNDGSATAPRPGDWGGLYFAPTSKGSLDQAILTFGGGQTPIEGGFDNFNAIEIHQADVRIANSLIEDNAGGLSEGDRNGRATNASASIFVRGAQPIVVNNAIQNNIDAFMPVISIDVNSLNVDRQPDYGRSTGNLGRFAQFEDNRGPLIRRNRIGGNDINAMDVRGGLLTTQSVWDDTDIVHLVRSEIAVDNQHSSGGLRLQSRPDESLVVKLFGNNAGFTAQGTPLDINDRIGGTVQIVGQPGYPVVLTSANDGTVGAGFDAFGNPQLETGVVGGVASGVQGSLSLIRTDPRVGATMVGRVGVSTDGLGTPNTGTLQVELPAGSTIELAILHVVTRTSGNVALPGAQPSMIGFEGQSVPITYLTNVGDAVASGANFETGKVDVTSIVASRIGSAGGLFDFAVDETVTGVAANVEGTSLTVVYSNPNLPVQTVLVLEGGLTGPTPQRTRLEFKEPVLNLPAQSAQMSLGIQFSANNNGVQFSQIDVNGQRLTTSAGHFDDSIAPANGALITVGGVGDSPNNPINPFSTSDLTDDERYDLTPFIRNGDTELTIETSNPSDDDSIFLAVFLFPGDVAIGGRGAPGDWRGVQFNQYSNDRNVVQIDEVERAFSEGRDTNRTPTSAQVLGELAKDEKSGDERRRLGFEVHGNISFDNPADMDVYSFQAQGGTEVWIDVDQTNPSLDTVIELVTAQGVVLAQSLDSIDNSTLSGIALPLIKDVHDGIDYFGTNPRDAGMRVVLPGSATLNSYFIRVRSQPPAGQIFNTTAGQTVGDYQFQIRLRHDDESPGSTVRFADIRFATTGIDIQGLPAHSPLLGESAEANNVANNAVGGAQALGNLLTTDRNTISVAADLSSSNDVDYFQFELNYDDVQSIGGVNNGGKSFATIFDVDYADGLSRPDTVFSVFDSAGRLILVGRDSNVEDDQPKPGEGTDVDDLSRGSVGTHDPYIGTVQLPAGSVPAGSTIQYTVGVSSNGQLPRVLDGIYNAAASAVNTRLEPINSVQRIVEDHIGFTGYTTSLDANGQPVEVLPKQAPPLLDIHSIAALETAIRPLSLSDVQLFVSTATSVSTINPQSGQVVIPNLVGRGNIRDIDLRSDGRLFAYAGSAGGANQAGFVDELDVGTVPSSGQLDGSDAVPDNVVTTDNVDAMTFRVVGRGGGNVAAAPSVDYDVYYSVRDSGGSRLFVATDVGSVPTDLGVVSGVSGLVTGLEFIGNSLFGVTSSGQFARFNPSSASNPANPIPGTVVDFTNFTNGRSVPFSGLAIGPQNLENGAYANVLFGVTNNGLAVVAYVT